MSRPRLPITLSLSLSLVEPIVCSFQNALGLRSQVDEDADRPPAPSSASHGPADLCCDGIVCLILIPLMVIRLACRIGGPLFSLFMVWYGPYCLAARGNV